MKMQRKKVGANVGKVKMEIKRGVAKSQPTAPHRSHKPRGAVLAGRGARGPMDRRS
jgi:hypothetical protein